MGKFYRGSRFISGAVHGDSARVRDSVVYQVATRREKQAAAACAPAATAREVEERAVSPASGSPTTVLFSVYRRVLCLKWLMASFSPFE